ncbi:MAG: outer membrane protein assembly factor BamA, partial [Gammaproteobacteria bacterium]|nr:outer membrane protein assembly factor BamA [Gammaproteobacteria bacterium]
MRIKISTMKKLVYFSLAMFLLLINNGTWAQQSFVVKKIEIQGLQRVSSATVESYLPIKRGQVLQQAKTAEILRSLYQTGFFEQVNLSRESNTLIIQVVERPTIGQLKISGNSVIPTDKLTTVMKSLDVAEGRVYNPSILEKIKQSLLNQYYQLGRYTARVDVNVTPMPRNRVLVKIDISEGLVAKVRRISIIGNHVFDESTLIKQMDVTTSGYITFITQTDRYSEEKLDSSLDKLRSYYMDRGYLKFEVKSAQAQVTPDRKSVYITIVVSEGQLYTVENVDVTGSTIVPREDLMKRIKIKPGAIFSRQKVLDSQKLIANAYGDKGYLFANISIRPVVNEASRKVSLMFDIKPGKRAYVRQVTFSDNTRTNDVVLRREIQQMEAAPASSSKLEESKQRLLLLPYIKEADMAIKPVPDVDDQVDVNYKVKEDSSAQASFKMGYSQVYGLIFGAGLNQKNFLGTGNTLGINFSRSKYEQFYGIDYTNPYYTEDGISRSISFSMSRVDPAGAGVSSGYTSNEFNLGVLYGIPIGQERGAFSRILAGVSYQNILIHLISGRVSNQVSTFVARHSRHFQEADFKLGISRDSRDRAIFPT